VINLTMQSIAEPDQLRYWDFNASPGDTVTFEYNIFDLNGDPICTFKMLVPYHLLKRIDYKGPLHVTVHDLEVISTTFPGGKK
jgi:hypothetical protein